MKKQVLFCAIFFCTLSLKSKSYAQQNKDFKLVQAIAKINTWKVKEIKEGKSLMYVNLPYNLGNLKKNKNDYLTIWAMIEVESNRPEYIAFTFPNSIIDNRVNLTFGDSLPDQNKPENLKTTERYTFQLDIYHKNNNSREAVLKNGLLIINRKEVDIFNKFNSYKYAYFSFKDSLANQQIITELPQFRNRFKELASPKPNYTTGNPADTALTEIERRDQEKLDKSTVPVPWEYTPISDPIHFKQFFKYFRYLLNHNNKVAIADLMEFPSNGNNKNCLIRTSFLNNFDSIFDKEKRRLVNEQKLDQFFRNRGGVLVGAVNCIWFSETRGGVFKITSISE